MLCLASGEFRLVACAADLCVCFFGVSYLMKSPTGPLMSSVSNDVCFRYCWYFKEEQTTNVLLVMS